MVWYSHLLKTFPQFVVMHTVKSFGIVNKAEVDVFLELSCFFNDPVDVGNLISGSYEKEIPKKNKCKKRNGCLSRPYTYLRKEENLKAKEKRKDIHI